MSSGGSCTSNSQPSMINLEASHSSVSGWLVNRQRRVSSAGWAGYATR